MHSFETVVPVHIKKCCNAKMRTNKHKIVLIVLPVCLFQGIKCSNCVGTLQFELSYNV